MNEAYENIKKIRKSKNMSQSQVADFLSITPANYGKLEAGKIQLTIERLHELSRVFEVKPHEILFQNEVFAEFEDLKNKNEEIKRKNEEVEKLREENKLLKESIEDKRYIHKMDYNAIVKLVVFINKLVQDKKVPEYDKVKELYDSFPFLIDFKNPKELGPNEDVSLIKND